MSAVAAPHRDAPRDAGADGPGLLSTSWDLIRANALLFGVLALCAFAPLLVLVQDVMRHGGVLTGVNGGDFFDQFQYLAWIRDEGSHGLASNLWVIAPSAHDYLHPMYIISGALWRLGLSLQLAYLIWKPVALLVLFLGFAAYVRHLVPSGRGAQTAALALALFYATPALAFERWLHYLSPAHTYQLLLAVDDADSVLNLWGFEHAAIAIGLMPVFLVACERILTGVGRRGWLVFAASVAGALVSWLHPWQSAILLAILGGCFVLAPPRPRYRALIPVVVATVLPLLYGVFLVRSDMYWGAFQHALTRTGTEPVWALTVSLAPIAVFAALGVRRPDREREWMLLLWPVACAAVYFLVPEFPPHALAGLTLPLAVLAVRGWRRIWAGRAQAGRLAAVLASVLVSVVTIPSLVAHFQDVGDSVAHTITGAVSRVQSSLTDDQAAAMHFLAANRTPGGVMAPWLLSMSVPGFTGRQVYAGHLGWEPQPTLAADNVFFGRVVSTPADAAARRAILAASHARFVLASCGPAGLGRALVPVARPVARFGCVTVYETQSAL